MGVLGLAWDFEASKPTSSDTLPPTNTYPPPTRPESESYQTVPLPGNEASKYISLFYLSHCSGTKCFAGFSFYFPSWVLGWNWVSTPSRTWNMAEYPLPSANASHSKIILQSIVVCLFLKSLFSFHLYYVTNDSQV